MPKTTLSASAWDGRARDVRHGRHRSPTSHARLTGQPAAERFERVARPSRGRAQRGREGSCARRSLLALPAAPKPASLSQRAPPGGGIVANGCVLVRRARVRRRAGANASAPMRWHAARLRQSPASFESIAAGSGIEARYVAAGGGIAFAGDEDSCGAPQTARSWHAASFLRWGAVLGEAIVNPDGSAGSELVVLSSVCNAGKAWRAALQEGFERQAPSVMHGLPIKSMPRSAAPSPAHRSRRIPARYPQESDDRD